MNGELKDSEIIVVQFLSNIEILPKLSITKVGDNSNQHLMWFHYKRNAICIIVYFLIDECQIIVELERVLYDYYINYSYLFHFTASFC